MVWDELSIWKRRRTGAPAEMEAPPLPLRIFCHNCHLDLCDGEASVDGDADSGTNFCSADCRRLYRQTRRRPRPTGLEERIRNVAARVADGEEKAAEEADPGASAAAAEWLLSLSS
eukprot:TRINITY_DN15581_c0_g1_i1.p2 TRINITY_DN15581_c0_g1~~TRINITY_DN15581_c0_g1_i1.p2  ORF type:complete len:116 (+),score=24.60 TRINITY_DN15581_c0_g1_i1:601-948(+)